MSSIPLIAKYISIALLLGIATICSAHNNVVVIPLTGDSDFETPVSPVSKLEPPNSDYFIRSNRVDDLITGLVWQRHIESGFLNWQDAWTFCQTLDIDGLTNWRLPDPYELISIVDYTERAPSININVFPDTSSPVDYWTSQHTSNFQSPIPEYTEALAIDFVEGGMSRHPQSSTRRVRCVLGRGASRGGILRDNNNGTITDLATKLTWEQSRSVMNWHNALNSCANLVLGGAQNWRVPNIKELVSIADYRTPSDVHSIDWFDEVGGFIWASHENISNTPEAWVLNAQSGSILSYPKNLDITVRCVR